MSARRLSLGSNCATVYSRQSSLTSIPEVIHRYEHDTPTPTSSNYSKKNRRPPPPNRNDSDTSIVPRMMWMPPQPISSVQQPSASTPSKPVNAGPVLLHAETPIAAAVRINTFEEEDDDNDPAKSSSKTRCCGLREFVQKRRFMILLMVTLLIVSLSMLTFAIVFVARSEQSHNDDDDENDDGAAYCGDECFDSYSQVLCSCDCYDENDSSSSSDNYFPLLGCYANDDDLFSPQTDSSSSSYDSYDDDKDYIFDDSILTSKCPPHCHRVDISPDWTPDVCRSDCYNNLREFTARYNDWLENTQHVNHNKKRPPKGSQGQGGSNNNNNSNDNDNNNNNNQPESEDEETSSSFNNPPASKDESSIDEQTTTTTIATSQDATTTTSVFTTNLKEPLYDDAVDTTECPRFCHRINLHQRWNPDDCLPECYVTSQDYDNRLRQYQQWQMNDDGGGGMTDTTTTTIGNVDVLDTRNSVFNSP